MGTPSSSFPNDELEQPDFGLAIGVDHYPRFRSLSGAIGDATRFHAWLCDPAGAGVALEHARLVTSTAEPAAPLQDHVDDALVELMALADQRGGGRRLYFYFSGHGATNPGESLDDVALLLAKWSRNVARLALSADRYRGKLASTGVFQELVIFLDCCRATAVAAVGLPPTVTFDPTSRRWPTRTFVAHATEAERPAFEQPTDGRWEGVFTRCLLAILQRSPGGITADMLKRSLEREVQEVSRTQRAHVVNGLSEAARFGPRIPVAEIEPITERIKSVDPRERAGHDVRAASRTADPARETPAVLADAGSEDYVEPTRRYSAVDTGPPLGPSPHASRLFVLVRRAHRAAEPARVPSEPLAIHDIAGRRLCPLSHQTSHADDAVGYLAFSARVTPGTYRLRATRSHRDLAITVPAGRAALVFIADGGSVRLDDLRVSLVHIERSFDPASPITHTMEHVIAALKTPGAPLPATARAMLPDALDDDLCFGMAVAHLAWRSRDVALFDAAMDCLHPHIGDIPDLAILDHVRRKPRLASPSLDAPPLLRASLVMALAHSELASTIGPDRPIARAARTWLHDSLWCTWSDRSWDERWIETTVDTLQTRAPELDAPAIARALALPSRTVEQTMSELDATLPVATGQRMQAAHVRVPGYVLGDVLGRGGQGTVFRARRERDGRDVAVKVVPLLGGTSQRLRAERELEMLQRFRHPALLAIGDHGALLEGAGLWLETELCLGSALDLVSEADAPLPVDRACRLVLDALEALAYLHQEGAVHRDIKPGNLLVRIDGSAVLGDLGLAKCLFDAGQLSTTGTAAGTVRFAPPEQMVDFKHAPPASDVWAMAATLYFLLTLDVPRDEYADQSELEAALDNPIVPLRERWPRAPDPLARCLDRALSLDVAARPSHGGALRDELVAALAACG